MVPRELTLSLHLKFPHLPISHLVGGDAKSPLEGSSEGFSNLAGRGAPTGSSPSDVGAGRVCASLKARLERDPFGNLLLVGNECGIQRVDPPMREKERLRSEFGLYPLNWEEPFGREHLVGMVLEDEILNFFMVGAESVCSEGKDCHWGVTIGGRVYFRNSPGQCLVASGTLEGIFSGVG